MSKWEQTYLHIHTNFMYDYVTTTGWLKHILLNYKNTLLTQIYKHLKQWIRTKDDNLIEFFSRYIQYNFSGELTSVQIYLDNNK